MGAAAPRLGAKPEQPVMLQQLNEQMLSVSPAFLTLQLNPKSKKVENLSY